MRLFGIVRLEIEKESTLVEKKHKFDDGCVRRWALQGLVAWTSSNLYLFVVTARNRRGCAVATLLPGVGR